MNKIYKVVWSKARNCYVVASELAKRHTKAPKSEVIARTVVAGILACTLSSGVTMSAFAESYEAGGGQAVGEDSIAIGDGSVANTDNSIAIGTDNTIDNLPYAIVIGNDNTVSNASGDYTVAGGYSGAVLIGNHVSAERQYGGNRFDSDNSGYGYDETNHVVSLPAEANKIGHVVGIGDDITVGDEYGLAIGSNSNARRLSSTAIGHNAKAEGVSSLAIGTNTTASDFANAIGLGANAEGDHSVAISKANTKGEYDLAVGFGSTVSSTKGKNIAVGYDSKVTGTATNAIGLGTNSSVSKDNAVAIGGYSSSDANKGVAIGYESMTQGANSVAIGSNSVASDDNVVSFGRTEDDAYYIHDDVKYTTGIYDDGEIGVSGLHTSGGTQNPGVIKRRLVNVADGIDDSDVATVGQMVAKNGQNGGIVIGSDSVESSANEISVGHKVGDSYSYIENQVEKIKIFDTDLKRRITNVADAQEESDAVTLGQVLSLIDTPVNPDSGSTTNNSDIHFVGVNSSGSTNSNYNGGGATGTNAIAIGKSASAGHYDGIAIGPSANAGEIYSMAIGYGANSLGQKSLALGNETKANGFANTVLGNEAKTNTFGHYNVVVGYGARTNALSNGVSYSVAMGADSYISGNSAIAIGTSSTVYSDKSVSLGNGSYANAKNSVAIGADSHVDYGQEDVVSFGYNAGTYLRYNPNPYGTTYLEDEDGNLIVIASSDTIIETPPAEEEYKRRLIHVADGIADSDVATVGQVRTMVEQSGSQSGSSVDISNLGDGNSVSKINNPIVIGRNSTVNNTYQGSQIAGDYEGSVLIGNNISATPDNGTGRYGSNDLFEIINNSDGTVNVPNEFEKVAHAVGIGDGVKIGDMDTVAIGSNAKATSKSATAVGHGANASSERSVALGMGAKASGLMSSALGFGSSASGMGSSALGSSSAKGDFDIALGWDASIKSTKGSNTAIGYESTVKENTQDAIALGSRSNVSKSNAVAIGTHSNVQGNNGVALGERTLVDANSSVAIGSNSVASDDNVVSFGRGVNDPLLTESQVNYRYSRNGDELVLTKEEIVVANQMVGTPEEYKRRLIHVADGINDSDVATVGQVTAMLQNSVGSNSVNYYGINSTGGSNVNGEEAIGTNAIAIGKDAAGVDKNTTAVGSHAWAIASGSVALGADSIATSSDEVSVGHQGGSYEYLNGNVGHGSSYSSSDGGDGSLYRRITNMKDGVGDHDAVTLGQMNRAVANFATSDSLDTKANIDLDNISDDGVDVVSTIAQRSMKVVAGQNTTVVESTDDNVKTYAVNVATNGAIAEGNEGIVTGGAIYDALQNVSAGTGEITPYTAGDGIAISNTKQISVVKDGEVEHGNTGLVTGGQVYDKLSAYNENLTGILDGVVFGIEDDLDTKAKKNLSNLDNSGKNVIRGLAQNSIELNAGQNTNLTVTALDGKLNYTIDTVANGEVANNNTGLMSGGAVYNEVRPANGNYIANNKTVAENLTVLDTSIKNVSDRVDAFGGTIADTTVVRYDSDTKDKLTLNGTQGTTLTNLKNGAVTASSTDAVTGSQLYSVKRSVDDHTTAINTLQGNVTENANAITALDGRVTSMEETVTNAFSATEELQTTVGGLETAVGNVQTAVNEMQGTVSGLATDVNGVKSTVASLQGDVATMQDDVSGLQNDMTSVKSDVSDVKDTLGTVQTDTAQIKENVTALQSDVGTLQQDVEAKANADGSNIDVAKFIEKMKAGENGVVTSEDLYVATRAQEDGAFVRKDASLSDNLLALDDGINRLNENVGKSHGLSVNFKNINDANYNGVGATGDNAMAIGPSAEASGEDSIAIGNGSKASGLQSIALGTGNQVSGNHSGAFGDPNDVSGDGSYAFGNDNTVSGNNTFVLGNNVSNASGNNTVVLGNDSDGSMDNVVSVGAEGAERKIVHVAKGDISQNSTDAVTGGQLFDVQEDFRNAQGINADKWTQALGTGTVEDGNDNLVTGGTVFDAIKDLQIAQDVIAPNYATGHIDIGGNQKYDMINTINVAKSDGSGRVITGIITDPGDVTSAANVGYVNAIGQNIADGVNEGFRKIDDKFSKAGASAAAMASLTPPPMDGDEKWAFSAAVGYYDGETAGAVGAFYRPQDNVIVNVRGAVGNGEDMVGAGVGVALQRGNTPSVSKAQLVRTVNAQAEKLQAQDNRMAEQSQVINEQNEKIASMQEQMMQMQETLRRLSEKSGM